MLTSSQTGADHSLVAFSTVSEHTNQYAVEANFNILTACSHDRAVQYYLEGLRTNNFHGLGCANANAAQNGNCDIQPGAWISSEPLSNGPNNLRGIFHFTTNNNAPFGRGPTRG